MDRDRRASPPQSRNRDQNRKRDDVTGTMPGIAARHRAGLPSAGLPGACLPAAHSGLHSRIGVCLALTGALFLGGCVTQGASPTASSATPTGPAIAFESIDGPPPAIFQQLVQNIDREAQSRGLPVVSREGNAAYRVRTYLSAQIRGKRTSIAWVFDVYDPSQRRALRLSGEEATISASRADAWSGASDQVLRRIAQNGVQGLAALVGPVAAPPAASPSPAPRAPGGPSVAGLEETSAPTRNAATHLPGIGNTLAFAPLAAEQDQPSPPMSGPN